MPALIDRVAGLRGEIRAIGSGAAAGDRLRIAHAMLHSHLRLGRGRHLTGWLPGYPDPAREVALRSGMRVLLRRANAIPFFEHMGLDVYSSLDLARSPVRSILDLGANVGFATLALRLRYPDARFVCVEPAPETRRLLEHNVERNGVAAQVFGVAVVQTPGRFAIVPSHFPAANTIHPAADGEIEGITLSALLDRAGIPVVDLMKIDIEGGERGVFADAAAWAGRVRAIVGELHDGFTVPQAAELLAPYGYRAVGLPTGERTRGLAAFVREDDAG